MRPSTTLKIPHPVSTSPKWKLQFGARPPCLHAMMPVMEPARTLSLVEEIPQLGDDEFLVLPALVSQLFDEPIHRNHGAAEKVAGVD